MSTLHKLNLCTTRKQVSTKHRSRINQNADVFTAIANYISLRTVHIMITKRKMMDMSK